MTILAKTEVTHINIYYRDKNARSPQFLFKILKLIWGHSCRYCCKQETSFLASVERVVMVHDMMFGLFVSA